MRKQCKTIFSSLTFGIMCFCMVPKTYGSGYDPSSKDSTKLVFEFQGNTGVEVRPGSFLNLNVPKEYSSRVIDFVAITHSQSNGQDQVDASGLDPDPGYTSFEVLPSNSETELPLDQWRVWGGHGSGPVNGKYAEARSHDGETDNLYEWGRRGHIAIKDLDRKSGGQRTSHLSYVPLTPKAFRVRSVGSSSIWFKRAIIKFRPTNVSILEPIIFSSGLNFGEFPNDRGRRYPGTPT